MFDRVRCALEGEQDVAYAVLFGSGARGALRPASDVDIAIELRPGAPRDPATLGRLTARLESAAEREVDLVLIDEAPAPSSGGCTRTRRSRFSRGPAKPRSRTGIPRGVRSLGSAWWGRHRDVLVVGGERLRRSDARVEPAEDLPVGHPVNLGPEPEVSGADSPVLVGDDGTIVLAGDRHL